MQHTAVNVVTMFWAPSNSWNFYNSHIITLDLFCCHCRRCSYSLVLCVWNCAESHI